MKLTGMFRALCLSMTVIAVLTVLATANSELSENTIHSGSGERELHELPYPHTHGWAWTTQPPTEFDYYTDDRAIDVSMIENKKNAFHEEHPNTNSDPDAITALESQRGEVSGVDNTAFTASLLLACGINAFLVLAFC